MATITGVCFWCMKDTGETREGDGEDRRSIFSYEPCEECAKDFGEGITFFEVGKEPAQKGQPPIRKTEPLVYPTGRFAVVSADEVERAFVPEKAKDMIESKIVLIAKEQFVAAFPDQPSD